MNKKYKLVIDADHLLYNVIPAQTAEGESIDPKGDLKKYKKRFKEEIERIQDDIALEFIKLKKKPLIIMSDKTNFRYDLYPQYKQNRKDLKKPQVFYDLQKWARKKFLVVSNCEADDVCGWYAFNHTEEVIITTTDKDVLFGTPGLHFDAFYSRRQLYEQGEYEAQRFTLMQTLAGDLGDGIPGLPRVGLKTAEKLLGEYGFDWKGVVSIYEKYGKTEEDAILMRRLVGMDQLVKTKKGKWKIKLFKS